MSEAEYVAALKRGALAYAIMIEVDHPEGMVRAWGGLGKLEYAGYEYEGLGQLLSIGETVSQIEIEVTQITFSLSGVDPERLAGLAQSVKGRTGQIYEAWLDRDYRVVHRVLRADVELDFQHYELGDDGVARIDIVGNGGMYHLLRRSAARWSPEEAKAGHADETGFDEMHLQEDAQLTWRA